ncbi:tail protein X [Dethiosulfovibrio salsuginis]|uniref:p2-like prophage tail protein X n=1 Tax=Dethiosulfovibrio salsuginis TaxID=561720 RepID=A0A1X7JMU5_9BACT|nr:tail protein X [Dethiosulfovibrio salsuginis]SMG29202.1 P2-like prophage tail protein X [Dethiosulfovibrio salsuginis]
MIVYRTRAGDSLDWVCWQHYGEQSGALEVVLETNQGLADYGPVLPRGLAVVLPDIVVPESRKEVSLWD